MHQGLKMWIVVVCRARNRMGELNGTPVYIVGYDPKPIYWRILIQDTQPNFKDVLPPEYLQDDFRHIAAMLWPLTGPVYEGHFEGEVVYRLPDMHESTPN